MKALKLNIQDHSIYQQQNTNKPANIMLTRFEDTEKGKALLAELEHCKLEATRAELEYQIIVRKNQLEREMSDTVGDSRKRKMQ